MTFLNFFSVFMGFSLLLFVFLWISTEVSARRKHREKIELIKLGHRPVNREGDQ